MSGHRLGYVKGNPQPKVGANESPGIPDDDQSDHIRGVPEWALDRAIVRMDPFRRDLVKEI